MKNQLTNVAGMVLALLFTGCASYHDYAVSGGAGTLPTGAKIFIAQAPAFTTVKDADVARLATLALANAARKDHDQVEVAEACASREINLAEARKRQCTVMLQPLVLVWQDNATEWSGNPDRVEFNIEAVDVATGRQLGSSDVRNSSGFFTPIGFKPQDLLAKTFFDYFRTAK